MSAKYKSPSFLLPNEKNTSLNPSLSTDRASMYSMDFDGSNYIDTGFVPANNLTLNCSISAWVNMPAISNNTSSSILGTYEFTNGRSRFFLRITRTSNIYKYFFGLGSGTGYIQDSSVTISNFSPNTWVHLALTYDGADVKLYSNGTLDGTLNAGNVGSYPPLNASFSGNTYIGATHRTVGTSDPTSSVEAYLTGKIDEVAIFNRALNTTEIAALYEGTSPNIYPSNLMATNLNPIAYYPLGEQAQNSGYLSATGNEWQFPNGVLQDYVMDFDGTDYIDVGDIPLEGVYTISFWINPDASPSNLYFLLDKGDGGSNISARVTQRSNNTIRFQIGSSNFSSTDTLTNNSWNNVVLIANGSSSKIYINNGTAATGTLTTAANTTQSFFIGTDEGKQSAYYFNGQMSNVVIWNSDQSANIANIYNNGSPQTTYTVTPQNWWKLNADSVYTPSAPNYTTALDFTSPSDYIDTGQPSGLGYGTATTAFSISVWAKTGNWNNKYIFSNRGSGIGTNDSGVAFSTSAQYPDYNGLLFRVGNNTNIAAAFDYNELQTNIWTHFVIVYDGSGSTNSDKVKIYKDNSSLTLTFNPGNIPSTVTSTLDFAIGAYTWAAGINGQFDGQISNLAVFNSVLTPAQVSTLFNFGTPETNISFSPTAWWKLDNTTTGIQDSSGNGNNGTIAGTPSQIPTSVATVPSWKIPSALTIQTPNYTTALDFVASQSDYIDTNSTFSSLTSFSISAWFKADVTNAFVKSIVSTRINDILVSQGLDIYINSNNLVGRVYDNGATEVTTSFTDTTNWHHVVLTYNGTTLEFYLDGSSLGTSTGIYTNSGVNLLIGQWTKTSGFNFDGEISNVSIFNSDLTSSQVSTLYNGGTPETAISFSPVSWWKLDTGGSTITDYGSGGNNGTNNGATQVPSDVLTSQPVNGVSTTLPSTALQQSDLQFDSPYSNYSLSFDGSGDYITVPNDSSLDFGTNTDFTLSMWIKRSSTIGTLQMLMINGDTNGAFWWRFETNNTIRFFLDYGPSIFDDVQTTATITDSNWHHLVAVADRDTQLSMYIDGQLSASNPVSLSGSISTTLDLIIGSTSGTFNGKIDETSIFNYALSSAQILEIYNNGKPKDLSTFSGTAPVSWWRLGENAYFDNNSFIVPNSISGAPNGTGAGSVTSMLSADAPGTYANGIGDGLAITDRVGDAPLSTSNSQSYNMIPSNKSPYVPGYVGNQIANNFSMTFDGSNDYIDVGTGLKSTFDGATAFTISAWFKYDTANPNYSTIIQQEYTVAGDNYLATVRLSNTSTPQISNRNVTLTDTTALNSGQWYHIVSVFDGSSQTLTMYIDGTQVAQNTSAGSSMPTSASGSKCIIGANANNDRFLDGSIDEVAIFDTALNAGQIKNDIYNASLPLSSNKTADLVNNPNLPTPVAWYRMGD